MSPRTEEESCAELRRVMHMQTMEEMAEELDNLNLSTEGSQRELHQRLLRFHLNESFPDVVRMPLNLNYGTISQINFQLAIDDAYFDWVSVSNGGKTIDVNMNLDEREQPIGEETECETCKIYFENPADTSHHNTEEEKSESHDKELTDYQLSCLNLLRAWILCNPYMKDETPKDFLGNLTDLRKFAKMDDEMLLKMLPCVLWPSIKSWYRTKNFNSWLEFELSFLEEYGSKPIDFPKSSDSTAETTASAQATTNTEASKSDCVDDEIIDKLSAVSVSQSSQQERQADKTEQESRWECIRKLKFLDLRFSGQKGLAAVMFMDDLNDFRSYSVANDRALLDVLPSVLDNDTKVWYRANKFTSWLDFEMNFIAGFKFNLGSDTSATIIQSKPSNLAAVPQPLHFNVNNSTNPNSALPTWNNSSLNLYPTTMQEPLNPNQVPQMQRPSIPNQPNHMNNPIPVSSQPTGTPSYSTNATCKCGMRSCFFGLGCPVAAMSLNSQSNHSSSQLSYVNNTPNSSLSNNTLAGASQPLLGQAPNRSNAWLSDRRFFSGGGVQVFPNQTSDLPVATTVASTVNQGQINLTGQTMYTT